MRVLRGNLMSTLDDQASTASALSNPDDITAASGINNEAHTHSDGVFLLA